MSLELPAGLRAAIERRLQGVSLGELAARSARLSAHYRAGGRSREAVSGEQDRLAYAVARLPATYAATRFALAALARRLPELAPASLLDVGCGPGTAGWASLEAFPGLRDCTAVDHDAGMLALARELAMAGDREGLASGRHVLADLASRPALPEADLVVASYCLAEIAEAMLPAIAEDLWRACRQALLLVEPGTPAGFARILACRTRLIALGAGLAAPCPHAGPCPSRAPGWCHVAVRLPRGRAHRQIKGAERPFEEEPFTYLAVTRLPLPTPPAGRLVGRPRTGKAQVVLPVCAPAGLGDLVVPRRQPARFKLARKLAWGDELPEGLADAD